MVWLIGTGLLQDKQQVKEVQVGQGEVDHLHQGVPYPFQKCWARVVKKQWAVSHRTLLLGHRA